MISAFDGAGNESVAAPWVLPRVHSLASSVACSSPRSSVACSRASTQPAQAHNLLQHIATMLVQPRTMAVMAILTGGLVMKLLSDLSQQEARLAQLEATLSQHTAAIGGANAQVASLAQTVARSQHQPAPAPVAAGSPPPAPAQTMAPPPPPPAPPPPPPAPGPTVAGLDGCPPVGPPDPTCTRIQRKTWSESWSAVPAEDKETWKQLDCGCKLRARPKAGMPAKCPRREQGWDVKAQAQVRTLKDKYAGERCVLVANGPSLNKIR
jgi:uncharacterized coiled-coil protein SlyX